MKVIVSFPSCSARWMRGGAVVMYYRVLADGH